ncbi:MAG: SUF system NifU family Fe-S cluster assembly protein [Myxococcales bacterium]|nr:SUF system NifU family Fe-S cluster assembly protein [Myxococcales bacterium]
MFDDLYQEIILDHNRRPRNCRVIEDTPHHAEGHNPLCGDEVKIFLKMEDDRVVDVAFQGNGCAISTASASLMTEALRGKTLEEAHELFGAFHEMVKGQNPPESKDLGKLQVFSGLSDYPMRVKCATLCWHTLQAAIEKRKEVVSVE